MALSPQVLTARRHFWQLLWRRLVTPVARRPHPDMRAGRRHSSLQRAARQTHRAAADGVRVPGRLQHLQRALPAQVSRARAAGQAQRAARTDQGVRDCPGVGAERCARAPHGRAGAPPARPLHLPARETRRQRAAALRD